MTFFLFPHFSHQNFLFPLLMMLLLLFSHSVYQMRISGFIIRMQFDPIIAPFYLKVL